MTTKFIHLERASLALLGILSFAQPADAQTFPQPNKGDLLAGFRKTGANQGTFELVVNIGNITNLQALTAGTSIPINNYTPGQLSNAFSDFNNLQWSVGGSFSGIAAWVGFPSSTAWFTVPRTDVNSQTTPPPRLASQSLTSQWILNVGYGANTISGGSSSNINNTPFLVREPAGDINALTANIGGQNDPTIGTYHDTISFSVANAENTTPASFSSAVRSDLYQFVQVGKVDPATGSTTGTADYIGYFQLNPDGTMTFTRAGGAVVPQPPFLKITRVGTTCTVSFLTTNSGTYTLYYTNAAGLNTSVSNWPASPTTVSGNGATNSIMDTTSDPSRIYRVGVH